MSDFSFASKNLGPSQGLASSFAHLHSPLPFFGLNHTCLNLSAAYIPTSVATDFRESFHNFDFTSGVVHICGSPPHVFPSCFEGYQDFTIW